MSVCVVGPRYPVRSSTFASDSVLLDRVNPFVGIRLRRLTLTGDDDLAVRGFELEVVLTALVVEGFKLCSHAVLSL
jgi:hypothetical protein